MDLEKIKKLIRLSPIIALVPIVIGTSAFFSTKLSFILFFTWNLIPLFGSKFITLKAEDPPEIAEISQISN